MSAIDSEVVFDQKMTTLGILPVHQAELRRLGWATMGAFAHSSSYTPGAANDDPFVAAVLNPVLARPDHPEASKLRRLFVESYTLVIADLKRSVEATDGDPPRRLPLAERVARMQRLAMRLPGFELAGDNEPSHRLVDLLNGFYEDDGIRYIAWTECTCRDQEVQNQKRDRGLPLRVWQADASGLVREKPCPSFDVADLSTDLRVKQALVRRSVAMEVACLMPFETHQRLVEVLFKELLRSPLAGFQTIGYDQAERADRHLFSRLAELTRTGVRQRPDGVYPLQEAMRAALDETAFNFLLMPLQSSRRVADASMPAERLTKKQRLAIKREAAKGQGESKGNGKGEGRKGGGKPDGPGKGPGKKGKPSSMPPELAGMLSNRESDNKRICWGYNLGKCNGASPGEACTRGLRVCCKPGCGANHGLPQHG